MTTEDNYKAYFRYAGLPANTDPEIIAKDLKHAISSAVWYFRGHKARDTHRTPLEVLQDTKLSQLEKFLRVGRQINFGYEVKGNSANNNDRRYLYTIRAMQSLGIVVESSFRNFEP